MICSSLYLDRFIVRLPYHDGLYTNLEEFQGLRSNPPRQLPQPSIGTDEYFSRCRAYPARALIVPSMHRCESEYSSTLA